MTTPFIFFEFDSSLFQKYYGSGINTPGIYAIPEDEVEPPMPPMDQIDPNLAAGNEGEEDDTGIDQRDDNRDNLLQLVRNLPPMQTPQMNADEQQAFDQEVQPLKKVYLLHKLKKLNKILQDNSLTNDDLLLVLKYGPYLTYNTLKILSMQIVNNLRNAVPDQYQRTEDEEMMGPENTQPPSNVIDNNTNGENIGANNNVAA